MSNVVEFWGIDRVMQTIGLSKSVVYREMRAGRFPQNHPYRQFPTRRFWLSREVIAWQEAQLDVPLFADEFAALMGE